MSSVVRSATDYLQHVYRDYREVAQDTVRTMRRRPSKAALVWAGLLTAGYALQCNPGRRDLDHQLAEAQNRLARVPPSLRNRDAYRHLMRLKELAALELLRHQSLGFFSLVYLADYSPETDLYKARCKFLRAPFSSLPGRLLDIGFLGRFRVLDRRMLDYDVPEQQ